MSRPAGRAASTVGDVGRPDGADAESRRRPWRLIMGDGEIPEERAVLDIGTVVMVRTRYLGSWVSGFEVADLVHDGYRLRRLSDGTLLAHQVDFASVRPEVDGP